MIRQLLDDYGVPIGISIGVNAVIFLLILVMNLQSN